jgi:hypothetical protein
MYYRDGRYEGQATPAAQQRLGYTRDAVAPPNDGVHVHFHDIAELEQSSPCENLEERVNTLEEAVAMLVSDEGDNEQNEQEATDASVQPGLSTSFKVNNSAEAALGRVQKEENERIRQTLPGHNRNTFDEPPGREADIPASKLPDIAEINRRNTAFWSGALTNKYTPNQGGSIDGPARLSDTPKQLDRGKTFGTQDDRTEFYRQQAARQARLVQQIEQKNRAFYARRGGR